MKTEVHGLAYERAQALMVVQVDAGGHRHFPGNRAGTFQLLDELTTASPGR